MALDEPFRDAVEVSACVDEDIGWVPCYCSLDDEWSDLGNGVEFLERFGSF